jgi:ABC-type multidrug transport system fused ATPase/permease subunit
VKRLLGLLRPYRVAAALSVLLAALEVGAAVAIPWLLGLAVDGIARGDRASLELLAGAILLAALVRLALSVARRLLGGRVSLAVEVDLRNAMYERLQAFELGYFARRQTGDLLSRATVDVQSVQYFLGYGLGFMALRGLTILFAAAAMLALEPGLGALALMPVPFVMLVTIRYGRRSRPALQEVQQRVAELTADVEENVSGVRAFHDPFIAFLPNVGLAVILLVGGRRVVGGSLSLGDFTAFYAYAVMLVAPLRLLGINLAIAHRATASGARIFELLDREPRVVSPPGAPALPAGRGRVELRGVSFAYGTGPPALREIDLVVEAGATVALVGATGSGKTTLVQLLGRLYDVTEGALLIDGARRALGRPAVAAAGDRGGRRRPVPVLGLGAREHRLRAGWAGTGNARGGRAGGRARAGGGVRRGAPGRLRHPRRRAGADALGRPAPAAGDRARPARRPAHPRARRRHQLGRRDHRAGDQGGAARADGGPHDVRDRPPALHRRTRR